MTLRASRVALGLAALLAGATSAASYKPDTSNWLCQRCPFQTGSRGETTATSGYISDEQIRYGNYSGHDEQGAYLAASGRLMHTGRERRLDVSFTDLGLASGSITLAGRNGKRVGYRAEYASLPWRRFDSTRSVYSGYDPQGALGLPPGWQRAATTAGFGDVTANLRPVDIETDRRTAVLGASYRLSPAMELFGEYRHQSRDGTLTFGGANFTQAIELPRRIEFDTNEIVAGLRLRGARGALQASYTGSVFDNRSSSLRWQNAFAGGAARGAAAEAPDNTAHSLAARAQVIGAHDSVAFFRITLTRIDQNEPLPRATINPAVNVGTLPIGSLDGRVDRVNWSLGFASRPFGWARLRVDLEETDRDNRTPVSIWERVIVDQFPSGSPEANLGYDIKRRQLRARATKRINDELQISGGLAFTDTHRDAQEVRDQQERDGWGQLRWTPLATLELSLKGGTAKREIETFAEQLALDAGQNPLLRKFNLAHRFREYGEAILSLSPAKRPFVMSAGASVVRDDFSKSVVGLTDSEELYFHLDLGWEFGAGARAYLSANRRAIETEQSGSQAFGAPDWLARHDDEFDSLTAGVRFAALSRRLNLAAEARVSRGTTDIALLSNGAGTRRLPQVQSDENDLRINASYAISDRLTWTAEAAYTSFETADWALTGVGPTSVPTLLSLGARDYDYDVWRVGVGVRYRFAR